MQDLLGRLTALDPDASETLKVVSYFDVLVSRSVGVESMLRGAALLSGASAGYRDERKAVRVRADGVCVDPVPLDPAWMVREAGPGSIAWIERDGPPHRNDAMVLERLALALAILQARRSIGTDSAVEIAISAHATPEERAGAVARLRLAGALRVMASPPDPTPMPQHPSAVIATRHGLTRATIVEAAAGVADVWQTAPVQRIGIGTAAAGTDLSGSWSAALIAVRLTTAAEPVVAADDLGAFLLIAEAAEGEPMHADVVALAALDVRSIELLDAVVDEQSVRGAAVRLGRHHSSVQERVTALVEQLGYDPRTSRGHTRYALARALLRLETD